MSEEDKSKNTVEEIISEVPTQTTKVSCTEENMESDGEINDEDGEINEESDGEINEEENPALQKSAKWENLENLELDFESDVNVRENNHQHLESNSSDKEEGIVLEDSEKDKDPDNKDEGELSDSDDNELEDLEEGELKETEQFPSRTEQTPLPTIQNQIPSNASGPGSRFSRLPICRFFMRGQCFYGADCKYLHISNNNYTMFPARPPNHLLRNVPMFIRPPNLRPAFDDRKGFMRRDHYMPPNFNDNTPESCKENNYYERNQYSEKPYNDRGGWKRNYNYPENDGNDKDYNLPPHRERGKVRSFEREILPNGREMERSQSPRGSESSRSRSRSNSYSDLSSDSESSFRSSATRSSYQSSFSSSRSPSPVERNSPTKSISSRKSEHSGSGRIFERTSLAAAMNSSGFSRDNKPYSPVSSNKDTSSKPYSSHSSTKRPLSPEEEPVVSKRQSTEHGSESSSRSRREHLLQQLKVVEDAIARKRSTKVR